MDNVWEYNRLGQNSVLAPQAAQMHNAVQGVGILDRLNKQRQEQEVRGILSQSKDLDSALPMLLKAGPLGIATAHQLAQVGEQQAKMQQAAKERAFFSPENQAKYVTGGTPDQPAEVLPDDVTGPARPAQAGTPGQFDLGKFTEAGAAAGVVKPEVLLNHRSQNQARIDSLQTRLYEIDKRSEDKNLSLSQQADLARQSDETKRYLGQLIQAGKVGPAPHMLTNADGVFQVNRDGTSTQVNGPDGKPLSGKATADRVIPAPIAKAYTENSNALRQIDAAIAAVEANPKAFGAKRVVGDDINQRVDPGGVTARARVADIGSLKIHDRSGAAVTASETPRLKPFVPAIHNEPKPIIDKLKLFKQQYEGIQGDISAIYSPDQGYKAFPTAPAPTAPAGATGGWSIKPMP